MQQRWLNLSGPTRLAVSASSLIGLTVGILLLTGAVQTYELITPGGRGPSVEVIAQDFGRGAVDPEDTGYDGQQTYAIARYFPDLDAAAEQTDSGRYRMLRILHAVVAWPFPAGDATVIAILLANLLGFGLAVRAAARLLERRDLGPRLAVAGCSPLLLGVFGSTAEPLAWGLALTAIDHLLRDRHRSAVLLFVLAALTRETTIVAAGLAGVGLFLTHGRAALRVAPWYALPSVVVGLWFLFLTNEVGGRWPGRTDPLAFLDLGAAGLIVPTIVFVLGVAGTIGWRDEPSLALPCLGFTAWMAVYTENVLDDAAIIRVNALPMILGILAIATWTSILRRSTEQEEQSFQRSTS